jgi:hypothetical protein
MKVHTRVCTQCCSQIEETRTRSDICRACADKNKLSDKFRQDKEYLESFGYVDVKNPSLNNFKQRVWTFTHSACGTEQTSTFNNLMTRIKKSPNIIPCSACKGTK